MRSWGCSPGDGRSSWSRTCSPSPQEGGPRGASQPGPGPHRPSALQSSQEAAQQRCHITVTLPDSSWCCRHHVQVGSRVGRGGRRAGRQLGGHAPLDPAPLPPGDFLPSHQPHPGKVLCPLPLTGHLPGSHGDILEGPVGSWWACVPPASPPHVLPRRSSPSSAAASTTASDTRCPCPAQRSRKPQVGLTAARSHMEGGWAKVSSPNCTVTWSRGARGSCPGLCRAALERDSRLDSSLTFVSCVTLGKALSLSDLQFL